MTPIGVGISQKAVQALVISCLDHCNSLLAGLPASTIRPLQLTQNAAARLLFNLNSLTLLRSLHWLPVAARIRFKTLELSYRAANRSDPVYIQDMVKRYTPAHSLRSASANRLVAPSLRANHSTKCCCPGSWMVKWAPKWHQDSRKSVHLPPQTKNTPLPTIPWIKV